MKIIDFALSHSRTFIAVLFFLIIAGTSTYINIPKEAAPDVNIPFIYISLSDRGISPEDSERLLVKPIEDEVKTVEGLKEMRSTAYSGGGNVLLEFDAGFDADKAMDDIREKVDRAKGDLPDNADDDAHLHDLVGIFCFLSILKKKQYIYIHSAKRKTPFRNMHIL